jgi:glutamate carboxypeptidase
MPDISISKLAQDLTWLDSQTENMVSLVESLCNQNSGTFNLPGLQAVAEILAAEFACLDGNIEMQETHPMETIGDDGLTIKRPLGKIIHICKRPDAQFKLLLCIHADTVYGVDSSFQKCRWLPDGRLNGPGVTDAKGGLVVMLYALKAFERHPLAQNIGWEVMINPDEEIGSPGSHWKIKEIASRCNFGLLFEPAQADGTVISWRKGVGNFSFVVRGRSAHAGRDFSAGRNAIVAMSRLMSAIADLNTDPEVTLNVGRVSGGDALNVVPDLAIGRVNVRITTNLQRLEIVEKLNRLVAEFNDLDGISVEMHGDFTSPPKMLTPAVEALQRRIEDCAHQLGIPIKWQGTGGASDGNKFADEGLANIDSLGPCGGCIHSSDEFLIVESLVPRAKLAALTMLSFTQQPVNP